MSKKHNKVPSSRPHKSTQQRMDEVMFDLIRKIVMYRETLVEGKRKLLESGRLKQNTVNALILDVQQATVLNVLKDVMGVPKEVVMNASVSLDPKEKEVLVTKLMDQVAPVKLITTLEDLRPKGRFIL